MKIVLLFFVAIVLFGGVIWYFRTILNEQIAVERRYVLLAISIITVIASLPCFGEFVYQAHDLNFHLDRIAAIGEELKNLQFPVRMQTTMMDGYGYATSLFYGDLFMYIPAIMYALGLPLGLCYNAYIIFANLFTVIIAYMCFKKIYKSYKIALVGATLYTLAAYRLINIYVRASVGEYTAMAFLPLLILGIWNFLQSDKKMTIKEYAPVVLGATAIFESHILSCEIIFEFLVVFFILNIKKFLRKDFWVSFGKSLLWIIGLNLYFIVPFFMSYGMDLKIKDAVVEDLQKSGLYLSQIASIFYSYCTGFSDVGTIAEMTLSLGCALFLVVLVVLVFMMNREKWGIKEWKEYSYARKLMLYGVIAVWLSSDYFPWRKISLFGSMINRIVCQIQFPWRYLEIATILLVCAFLCVLKVCEKKGWNKQALALAVSFVSMTILSTEYFISGCIEHGSILNINHVSKIGTECISGKEYLLQGTDETLISEGDLPYVSKGEAELNNYSSVNGVKKVECENNSEQSVEVTMPIFNYDNYRAYDETSKDTFKICNGQNNTIAVEIPAGYSGTIVVKYQEPIGWRISEIISLIAVVGFICLNIRMKKQSNFRREQIE